VIKFGAEIAPERHPVAGSHRVAITRKRGHQVKIV
jgi:hypothetical protein